MRTVAKYLRVECECGTHLVNLYDPEWNRDRCDIYSCHSCNRPLVCRGEDKRFYFVGRRA